MGFKGYDYFCPSPDVVVEMKCKVCSSICDVKRGVNGPTSWAGAMARKKHIHDRFTCPYSKEEWHKLALELALEIDKSHSPSLKKIMQDDLNEIIKKEIG